MYKLCVYIPEGHLDEVKDALFAAGGGRIGNYDRCCWQVAGEGQFRALPGSQPYVGHVDELECVPEYRVELVVDDAHVAEVVAALRQSHPYEEPAFDLIRLEPF